MTVQVQLALVRDPSVWTATQQGDKQQDWSYVLTPNDIAELDTALQQVKQSGRELTVSTAASL